MPSAIIQPLVKTATGITKSITQAIVGKPPTPPAPPPPPPAPEVVPPPAVMPSPTSANVAAAKKASLVTQLQRRGRASTVLAGRSSTVLTPQGGGDTLG